MTALIATLLGAGIGLGLLLIARAFRGQQTSLGDLSKTLGATGRSIATAPDESESDGAARSSSWAAQMIRSFGLGDIDLLESRLRVLDKSVEQHAFEKLIAAVAGLCLPILLAVLLLAMGVSPPLLLFVMASLLLAVGGFLYPDLPLAEQVEERRRSFRHSLGAYLELVCVMLAGGAGTQTALAAAAESGDGWAFVELRRAINRAQATNRGAHELFDELGQELGVVELRDLAASLALVGGHGARVKESLIAKSEAMRHSLAADLEAMAETRTEKMIIPVAIMTVGLTLFVGFGALTAITSGTDSVGSTDGNGIGIDP